MTEDRSSRSRIYLDVAQAIIEAVEAGAGTFTMPWHTGGVPPQRPVNAATGKAYRGINVLSLWVEAQRRDYRLATWASYRQWQALGAQVRRGERGTPVVYFTMVEVVEHEGDRGEAIEKRPVAKWSRIFNSAQVDGWYETAPPLADLTDVLLSVEEFREGAGAEVRYGFNHACYRPKLDVIEMPNPAAFGETRAPSAIEAFCATLLHEMVHWTAHPSRLARDLSGRFGDAAYAMEELIAEFGAAFLCANLKVTNVPRPDHAAYVSSWLQVLKDDPRALFTAAGKASAAVDYLDGLTTLRMAGA